MRVIAGAVCIACVGLASPARADDSSLANWMIGPMIGLRLKAPTGANRLVLGFEGGAGYGPERINLGFEHRAGKDLYYAELDGWFLAGGTAGAGVDSDGNFQAILGLWEGLPIQRDGTTCAGWHPEVAFSFGYRYTGVHELYVAVKAGEMLGNVCID